MATSADFSESVIEASDELVDIYCEPCADDGKQIEAEGFCVDCSEYLCGQCYKNHTRYKAFKHHVLQDKNKMPVDAAKARVTDVCIEKCAVHSAKVIEYFCRSCDKLGCTACITVNHRLCKNVDHIPNIVKDLEKSEELKEFKSKLDKKLEAVTERKKKITSSKTQTEGMKTKAKAELKQQQEEIKNFFANLELEMERRIEDIDKNNKETLKTAATTCDFINDELDKMKSDTDNKLKNEQKCELFIAMKRHKSIMDEVDKEFEKLETESKIQRYALTPSSQMEAVMKSTSEICTLRTTKFGSEINVGTKNDKEKPVVCGHAMVQNHYLAITDLSNGSVKVFDTRKMNLVSEMDMSNVRCITSVKDKQIAVLLRSGKQSKIFILSISTFGSLSKDYQIPVNIESDSMAYSRDKLFIVARNKIVVIDMQGQLLETIKTTYSKHIALSPDQETIYMTNVLDNTVTSMTLEGKIKTVYQDEDLKFPQGITVDNEGLVYVRNYGNSNVHQLTADCTKVQILIENVPGTTITYSNTEKRFYLGCANMVKVYQME
ncbi:E3 ubiquitin-protein ligase TRIM36-like [Mercenaria mercenaria]|uniref:E3 ubiquitin-protein ligase TRIM36-like n=1 Tax=Mercenaria mercenaria TaxID=6596 RepID=UPI00234F1384|nr:E3 ubiquitin-protein ligase TRIM36-like [Mercenaria mercenaria]